jgi:uncharacterized protein (TIGR00730 family)
MATIRSICVYCGSSPGRDLDFISTANTFGQIMAREGVTLVYGGGAKGLMGAVADGVIMNGGKVLGVIPEFLKSRELEGGKEAEIKQAAELIVTRNMHERKQIMFERADAFVALPGGIGTLEELVEQLTWSQLGRHKKPILLANINGFWDPLCELLDHMKKNGFIHSELNFEFGVANRVEDILPQLRAAAAKHGEVEEEGEREVIGKM